MTGKIYIIRNIHDENLIYIGSTFSDLNYRFYRHKFQNTTRLHKYITDTNDSWDNWNIELYQEFECDNKEQLHKREGEVIRLFLNENPLGTLNKCISGRTKAEYIRDNIDRIKQIRKNYYINNINKFSKIITCDCGRNVRADNIYRHYKSNIHKHHYNCEPTTSTIISVLPLGSNTPEASVPKGDEPERDLLLELGSSS